VLQHRHRHHDNILKLIDGRFEGDIELQDINGDEIGKIQLNARMDYTPNASL
jgi:hypothetical protein